MTDTNSIVIIGRLTRDVELKQLNSGVAVAKFSIAVNRSVKKGDVYEVEASFFDVELWGRMADALQPYLLKGKQVGITGHLKQERWTQDGQNRSKVIILAESLQLIGGNQNGPPANAENVNGGKYHTGTKDLAEPRHTGQAADDGFTDDIPF